MAGTSRIVFLAEAVLFTEANVVIPATLLVALPFWYAFQWFLTGDGT